MRGRCPTSAHSKPEHSNWDTHPKPSSSFRSTPGDASRPTGFARASTVFPSLTQSEGGSYFWALHAQVPKNQSSRRHVISTSPTLVFQV